MEPWIADAASEVAVRAERDLEALVAISSPSGDVEAAEECVAVIGALAPPEAAIERLPCSTSGHADDVIVRLTGTGSGRVLLLGHLDTVVDHDEHRPLTRDEDRLHGSGTIDMKGGDALALGVMHAFSARPSDFAELALLLVTDEEWRSSPFGHVERFAGWDACLCFEAGQRSADGGDGVVVRRKAAGTLRVVAHGLSSHSGSAPERGRNALLALAEIARTLATANDPTGPDRLTVVPTKLHSGEAFNVVPGHGELFCDMRAARLEAFEAVCALVPPELDGVRIESELVRTWPGMDAREAAAPLLADASALLGRPIAGGSRGGASDASHFAASIPVTVDGLGPLGGGAHAPSEHVLAPTLLTRAEVALAVAAAALGLQR